MRWDLLGIVVRLSAFGRNHPVGVRLLDRRVADGAGAAAGLGHRHCANPGWVPMARHVQRAGAIRWREVQNI